jgi:UDP-glucose 4-epimerase
MAVKRGVETNHPINLATGNQITINKLTKLISEKLETELEISYKPERVGDIKSSSNSSKLLRKIFPDFKPTSFQDGLFSTINWYQESKQFL